MTPRSIRRAQERKALKLARKAEKAALQNREGEAAAAPVACEAPPLAAKLATSLPLQRVDQPHIRMADVAFLNDSPSPEILDEFSPELIAEANAVRERVWRRAGLLPSQPGVSNTKPAASPAPQAKTEPEALATNAVSSIQLAANRANSQLSTGATTPAGKQTVSFNAFRHGLAGRFVILASENENEFKELYHGLQHEHTPSTPTEHLLIEGMAQHYWLAQRALGLQQFCFNEAGVCENDQQLALYLRYQTTHDRAFHKCLNDLLKLRAEKRKEQNGFVSQERKRNEEARKEADEVRRQARENRQQERHKWADLMDSAKVDHQVLLNMQLPGSEPFTKKAIQRIIAVEKAAA